MELARFLGEVRREEQEQREAEKPLEEPVSEEGLA